MKALAAEIATHPIAGQRRHAQVREGVRLRPTTREGTAQLRIRLSASHRLELMERSGTPRWPGTERQHLPLADPA